MHKSPFRPRSPLTGCTVAISRWSARRPRAKVKILAQDLVELTLKGFGVEDQRTIRAGELMGVIQRLR